MNWLLLVRREAEEDLTAAAAWYAEQANGLDERFLADVDDCFAFLLRNPHSPASIDKHHRQFPLATFPFHVVYSILDDTVLIMRVYHMKRDSKRKFSSGPRPRSR